MSYPNNMTKDTLDSLVKAYADSIISFKNQEKIEPLDLVLPGIHVFGMPTLLSALVSKGADMVQRFRQQHSVITTNGIYPRGAGFGSKPAGSSPADPIRESLGCFWIMSNPPSPTVPSPIYARKATPSTHTNYLYTPENPDGFDLTYEYMVAFGQVDAYINNEYDLSKLAAGHSFKSTFKPNYLFQTPGTYFQTGVEHFEFTEPIAYGPEQTFDFKTPIFDLGYNQYLKIHYNFSKAAMVASKEANQIVTTDQVKKVLPLTLLCGIEQKSEGIKTYFQKDGIIKERTATFDNTPSPTNWEAPFPLKGYYFSPSPDSEANEAQNANMVQSIMQRVFGAQAPNFYEDISFRSKACISDEVTKLFGEDQSQNDSIADVVPHYNFTSPFWEKALVNFQLFTNVPQANYRNYNKELAIGNIYTYCSKVSSGLPGEEKIKFQFNKYGNQLMYCALDSDGSFRADALKFSNIFFTSPAKKLNQMVDDTKYQFPMYNEITFKSEPKKELGIMLEESGMLLEFFSTLLSYLYGRNQPLHSMGSQEAVDQVFADIETLVDKGILLSGDGDSASPGYSVATKIKRPTSALFGTPESYTLANGNLYSFDFLAWLQNYVQYLDNPQENWSPCRQRQYIERSTKFFGLSEENLDDALDDFSPKKILGLLKFMPKFQECVTKKTRALHDIFSADNNNMAYSETIMYKITKIDGFTGLAMQNIFLPLDSAQDTIKYIDTQVAYGRPYRYVINAVKIVVGTEYKYNGGFLDPTVGQQYASIAEETHIPGDGTDTYGNFDLDIDYISYGTAAGGSVPLYSRDNKTPLGDIENVGLSVIEVKYRPTVRIIEVPYYSEDTMIVDNPPMPPLTNIYPLSGQKNKLLLTFENQTGDRNLVPISLGASGDEDLFDIHRAVQKRTLQMPNGELYDPTIRFKADDSALYYQVFKIAGKKPTSYSSFSDSLAATVSMENLQAGFEDTIATNIKYYYTFRTVDRHGNISNPTPVYEVEMVEDSGVTYPIIKVIDDFDKPVQHVYSKSFRRFMMIDAADQHVFLNEEKTGIVDDETALTGTDPVLGTADKSLWNDKAFKFRIKSKQTGKMIDLNLSFKTNHIVEGNENTNLCD
jgi:hypothetical protein